MDINGVILKWWDQHPGLDNVYVCDKKFVQIRSGLIDFLDNLTNIFHVGNLSSMVHSKLEKVISLLHRISKKVYPFFIVWGQEKCYVDEASYTCYEGNSCKVFKPIWYLWYSYPNKLFRHNTIVLDDSPYSSCMNPKNNCIFLESFTREESTAFLNTKLWPYLQALKNVKIVDDFICKHKIGKLPITINNQLFKEFGNIILNATWRKAPSSLGKVSETIKGISKMEVVSQIVDLDICQLDIL